MVMVDVATRTLTVSGGGESHSVTIPSTVLFTPPNIPLGILCENISSEAGGFEIRQDWRFMNANAIIKRFQVYYNNILAYDLIPVQNANDVTDCGLYDRIHRKYYPGANYYNNVPFTAGTATGEVINQLDECVEAGYLRVNNEWWEIYNGGTEYFAGNYIEITENNVITSTLKAGTNIQIADDGTISASATDVTQIVTSGTEIAQINGTSIYAPTVSATQTQTSGTEIATINVGNASTKLYAPTPQNVSVTQTQTSGTEIAEININDTITPLYAPTADVSVKTYFNDGVKVATIIINGVSTDIYAPTGGGGGDEVKLAWIGEEINVLDIKLEPKMELESTTFNLSESLTYIGDNVQTQDSTQGNRVSVTITFDKAYSNVYLLGGMADRDNDNDNYFQSDVTGWSLIKQKQTFDKNSWGAYLSKINAVFGTTTGIRNEYAYDFTWMYHKDSVEAGETVTLTKQSWGSDVFAVAFAVDDNVPQSFIINYFS